MTIGNMRGRIVVSFLFGIVVFILGWTLGQVFQDLSPFTLDWSISLSDVLAILVEIGLAIILAILIEKGMQNLRVEKDFYINELSDVQQSLLELEKSSYRLYPMSLNLTVFQVEKSRRDLAKMWSIMKERNRIFYNTHNNDFDKLLKSFKMLNSQLSDSNFFKEEDGYKPVRIIRGTIHLNGTVIEEIDKTFDSIKDRIFKMKIAINDM